MGMKYIIYTEIISKSGTQRWFYGRYDNEDRANDVAYELGQDRENGIYHCVCDEDEAKKLSIQNMPED